MRILLIGPHHAGGSIPPYLDVFTAALRFLGVQVDHLGTSGVPYDKEQDRFWTAERVRQEAEGMLADVDVNAYDLLSVHFGNLDVEQLLPQLWPARRPPAVYHLHSLDWTLFTDHIPEPDLREAVNRGVVGMDAFVCFGTYGAERLETLAGPDAPRLVSWLPTTIPSGTLPRYPKDLAAALEPSDPRPLGSLYGYATPWKDTENLIAACKRTKEPGRMIVAGPFWDDPSQAGLDLAAEVKGTTHGSTQLRVVPTYLDAAARLALVTATDFAIFPYRTQPTFQGSGAIADYLAHGVPVLATDVANMAELIGDAGVVMEPANPQSLADAVDRFIHDVQHRKTLASAARCHARRFSAVHHAAQCLRFYDTLIRR
ncbi:glycosyltransferase family 4 protein [Verrucosispora sp. WMMD703]|uniref:glycosyltransferase family 4 protein n=1 Tax=Verrucosispora sp. WMMD703 TaxID=3403463 RepID=UPI003B924336